MDILENARRRQMEGYQERMSLHRDNSLLQSVDIKKNIAYRTEIDGRDGCVFDLIAPKGEIHKRPVIINIHGGGWVTGFKELNELQSCYFAKAGCYVINTNYKLMPEADFYEVVQELRDVLLYIKNHNNEYNFDLERVYITADSAGAHFALLTAVVLKDAKLRAKFRVQECDVIAAVAVTCPVVDTAFWDDKRNPLREPLKLILADIISDKIQMSNASVPVIITPENCPKLYILTTPEDTDFYGTSKELHERLEEKKIAHKYCEYSGAENRLEHVFNVTWPEWKESQRANDSILKFFEVI